MKTITIIILTLFLSGSTAYSQRSKENIGGKQYNVIRIGDQVWMEENLNYEIEGSLCHDKVDYACDKYGRFYNWNAAKAAADKIQGWHLPSDEEWFQLADAVGGKRDKSGNYAHVGAKLKSGGRSQFEALVVGYHESSDDTFRDFGISGNFWVIDSRSGRYSGVRSLFYTNDQFDYSIFDPDNGYSVRLVKD